MDTGYPALTDSFNEFHRMRTRLKPMMLKHKDGTFLSCQSLCQTTEKQEHRQKNTEGIVMELGAITQGTRHNS